MKVIILCGGKGTRLKEETEYKPKPMVAIGGKPILLHLMKIYAHYGFTEFILALGYKAEYIKDYFINQKAYSSDFEIKTKTHEMKFFLESRNEITDFKITFVDTGIETQIGERILACKKYIPETDEHFMWTYGDGVTDLDMTKLVEFHKKQNTIGTITGVHPRSKYGIIKLMEDNKVAGFEEKPVLDDWINGGFGVYKRAFFDYLKPNEMEHPALKRLAAKKELSIYKHEGFWASVDTNKELEDLNATWNSGEVPWKVWQ
ncbi:MAG TPA: sugar phosphate nucleotidyltransferase [Candidatus Sulfotelmatobacter sp.]|jgi:glucose-1-phosphate cytidylyltransferase|nr:sugar phosphate nucleotidyltransferase [Candidatus Sulfotelmatobacter sp.]